MLSYISGWLWSSLSVAGWYLLAISGVTWQKFMLCLLVFCLNTSIWFFRLMCRTSLTFCSTHRVTAMWLKLMLVMFNVRMFDAIADLTPGKYAAHVELCLHFIDLSALCVHVNPIHCTVWETNSCLHAHEKPGYWEEATCCCKIHIYMQRVILSVTYWGALLLFWLI